MSAPRRIVHGLVMIAAMTLLAWLLDDLLDRHWIDVCVRGRGTAGELMFVGIAALLVSIGLSRQVIAFLGGYGFGFGGGLMLSMAAVVAGCMVTFWVARVLLHEWPSRRFEVRNRQLYDFLNEHTFSATLLVRLLPVGNNWLVNILAGASAVRSIPFFLGSALGYLPQMVIFALVGSGTRLEEYSQVVIAMAMFVAAALIGVRLFTGFRRHHRPPARYGGDLEDSLLANQR